MSAVAVSSSLDVVAGGSDDSVNVWRLSPQGTATLLSSALGQHEGAVTCASIQSCEDGSCDAETLKERFLPCFWPSELKESSECPNVKSDTNCSEESQKYSSCKKSSQNSFSCLYSTGSVDCTVKLWDFRDGGEILNTGYS